MIPVELRPVETEADRVEAWRALVLVEAGYPAELAVELAQRADVDVHQAVELVRAGCPPDTAASILT